MSKKNFLIQDRYFIKLYAFAMIAFHIYVKLNYNTSLMFKCQQNKKSERIVQ